MKNRNKQNLLTGSVNRHLFSLTWPGIGGSLAITIFNLTDTFFVSRLGTDALAAMGFTFPVVMAIGAAAMGISLGSGSVLSRAMGSANGKKMKRTATDGIALSLIFVAFISGAGLLTLNPLFSLMGAEGKVLELVKEYMFIWYLGSLAVIMPPVSDSCLRATGDMIRPLVVMIICAVTNALLDPIFIFGLFGFPAMGIGGAALATVISRVIGMVATLSFLHFHAGLLDLTPVPFKEVIESWKEILHVGLPSAMTQLLVPFTRAVVTRLAAAAGGAVAVAAVAVGSRIEGFAAILVMSYSMALVPMIGQNWGAEKKERVEEVKRASARLALIYGILFFIMTLFFAESVAQFFSTDIQVAGLTALYLRIVAASSAALAYYTWISQSLNAAGKPGPSARLNVIGVFIFILPLSAAGTFLYGFPGLMSGLAIGQILTAWYAFRSGKEHLK
jgi:putative MATE family efflux protein